MRLVVYVVSSIVFLYFVATSILALDVVTHCLATLR